MINTKNIFKEWDLPLDMFLYENKFILKKEKNLEIYLKPPTSFILRHWKSLLPDWTKPPQAVIIILQKAQFPLNKDGKEIEQEKNRLLEDFFKIAQDLKYFYDEKNILVNIISPKDGYPMYSTKGEIAFDLSRVIAELLEFEVLPWGNCYSIHHPDWKAAVYPGLMVSGASCKDL